MMFVFVGIPSSGNCPCAWFAISRSPFTVNGSTVTLKISFAVSPTLKLSSFQLTFPTSAFGVIVPEPVLVMLFSTYLVNSGIISSMRRSFNVCFPLFVTSSVYVITCLPSTNVFSATSLLLTRVNAAS